MIERDYKSSIQFRSFAAATSASIVALLAIRKLSRKSLLYVGPLGGALILYKFTRIDKKDADQAERQTVSRSRGSRTWLNLSWEKWSLDDEIIEIIKKNKKLTYLNLSWCGQVTDKVVAAIAQNLPDLEHLDLSGCGEITDKAINAMACHEKLTQLHLVGCHQVTSKSIEQLPSRVVVIQY